MFSYASYDMGVTHGFQEKGEQHQKQAVVFEYVGLLVRDKTSFIISVLNLSEIVDVSTIRKISE